MVQRMAAGRNVRKNPGNGIRSLAAAGVVLLAFSACNPFAPKCTNTTAVVEDVPGAAVPSTLSRSFYEGLGYECVSDGAIRNAFGVQIGTRYVCTKCQ